MGEEEKKPEEKKMEGKKTEEPKKTEEVNKEQKGEAKQPEKPAEEKKEDKNAEESKDGKESKQENPPPPQEIVLKVYMHCEGCARKVRRSLKGFEGVEDVVTDCKTSKVIVKGEKADPLKVLERVQRKSHRQVDLLSPIPAPPPEKEKKPEEIGKPQEEKKKEEPQVITVFLKVHMHCDACGQEIKKRILRMKGVESAEPDLKNSLVRVKGVFEPAELVEYVYKRTGKHALIVKQEPEKNGNKAEEGEKGKKGGKGEESKENKGGGEEAKPEEAIEETKVVEPKKNEYYYYPYPPRYSMEVNSYGYGNGNGYPPQIFSDENPNACSVM